MITNYNIPQARTSENTVNTRILWAAEDLSGTLLLSNKNVDDNTAEENRSFEITSSEGEVIKIQNYEEFDINFSHICSEVNNAADRLVWISSCFTCWLGLDEVRIITLDLHNIRLYECNLAQIVTFSELGKKLIEETSTDQSVGIDIDISENEKKLTVKLDDEESLGRHDLVFIWKNNSWVISSITCAN